MPSHWANAHKGRVVRLWVREATPPHPYKPLGFFVESLPHRYETFCFSTKGWGQVDIFPYLLDLEAPSNLKLS